MKLNKTVFRVYIPLILTLLIIIFIPARFIYLYTLASQNKGITKTYWRDLEYRPYKLQFSLPPKYILEKVDPDERFPLKISDADIQIKIRKWTNMGELINSEEEIPMLTSLLEIDFQKYLVGYDAFASDYKFYEYPLPQRKAVMLSSKIELKERDKSGKLMRFEYPTDLPKEWSIKRGSIYFINNLFIHWDKEILVIQVTSPKTLTNEQLEILNKILISFKQVTPSNNVPRQE